MNLKRVLRAQWDRTAAILAVIAGLVALLLGYLGVSGTPYVAAQLPYIISGGVLGLFFVSIGVALWISADLRDDWRELRACHELLRLQADEGEGAPAPMIERQSGANGRKPAAVSTKATRRQPTVRKRRTR